MRLRVAKMRVKGNDMMAFEKIYLSSWWQSFTCIGYSIIFYFILKRSSKLDMKTINRISLGLLALQPIYPFVFVRSFDSLRRSWRKLSFMFWLLFNGDIYTEFTREKKEIQKKIIEMVD